MKNEKVLVEMTVRMMVETEVPVEEETHVERKEGEGEELNLLRALHSLRRPL